jgi:hypothetical protein
MLDSLVSTLSAETVNSFTRNGKKPVEDELSVDEVIRCLEMQVGWPPNEKKRVVPVEEGGSLLDLSTPGTPGRYGYESVLVDADPTAAWEIGLFGSAYAFVAGSGGVAG